MVPTIKLILALLGIGSQVYRWSQEGMGWGLRNREPRRVEQEENFKADKKTHDRLCGELFLDKLGLSCATLRSSSLLSLLGVISNKKHSIFKGRVWE